MELLVSVRNHVEAKTVARTAAAIIDLKEPDRGSLGAVTAAVAREVADEFGESRQLSLAMGELADFQPGDKNQLAWLADFCFAKIGLAGCDQRSGWQDHWLNWAAAITPQASPVLVCYADHDTSAAPPPEQIVQLACRVQPAFFLIDTFGKDGRNLFDYLSVRQLNRLFEPLRNSDIGIAVAGSLDTGLLPAVSQLAPDIVAVRGAACETNQRTSAIDRQKVEWLCRQLRRYPSRRRAICGTRITGGKS